MALSDHYRALGVPCDASDAAIKQAYRRLAKDVHPDKGGEADLFSQLANAAQVLLDPAARKAYDQAISSGLLHAWKPSGRGGDSHDSQAPASGRWPDERQQPAECPSSPTSGSAAPHRTPSPANMPDPGLVHACMPYGVTEPDLDDEELWAAAAQGKPLQPPTPPSQQPPRAVDGNSGAQGAQQLAPIQGMASKPQSGTQHAPQHAQHVDCASDADTVVAGALLDLLAAKGLACDAATQLVVTCEVCHKPATRSCWVCGADICELCTRAQHWKGRWGLHWPVVNQPGAFFLRLAQQDFERKRLTDAAEWEQRQPGYLPEWRRQFVREWQGAVTRASSRPGAQRRHDPELARHYMWAQTDSVVYVAVHLPTGSPEALPQVQLEPQGSLRVWTGNKAEDGQQVQPPALCVVDRVLAGAVCGEEPAQVHRTGDGRFALLSLPKARPGCNWPALFVGDSHKARCIAVSGPPLYTLSQHNDEVILELNLPAWVGSQDVKCDVTCEGVTICVTGLMDMRRVFWRNKEEEGRRPHEYSVVQPDQSIWDLQSTNTAANTNKQRATPVPDSGQQTNLVPDCVRSSFPVSDSGQQTNPVTPQPARSAPRPTRPSTEPCSLTASSWKMPLSITQLNSEPALSSAKPPSKTTLDHVQRKSKLLSLVLARPPLTQEERTYKHGVRQDNLGAQRADGRPGGCAFFVEDEAEWELTPLLQAAVFKACGMVFLVPRPWQQQGSPEGRWATCKQELPQDTLGLLNALQ